MQVSGRNVSHRIGFFTISLLLCFPRISRSQELCSISSNVAQMVSMLKECCGGGSSLIELDPSVAPYFPLIELGASAVKNVKNVYLGLQELLTNFKRIILPESLKVSFR